MPTFRFNLQAVLEQRERIEDERQRALGELLAKMAEHEREIQALDQTVKSAAQDLRDNRLVGKVDVAFIAGHRRFVLSVERKASAIIQKMALLQREIDQARQLLIAAARDVKVIEKLRERKLAAWKAKLATAEQNEIDEVGARVAVMQWTGRQQGEGE